MNENRTIKRESIYRARGVSLIMRWLKKNRHIESFVGGMCETLDSFEKEAELFLVGGCVRDLVEGKPSSKDIDLMVTNLSYKKLGQVLSSMEKAQKWDIKEINSVGKHFPVYKVSVSWFHNPVDVALARVEQSTGEGHRDFQITTHGVQAKEDSRRRDFTINAIFFKFTLRNRRLKGEIIDYQGGIQSLVLREIKAVGNPEDRFSEDPLRMLRAIRQKNERKCFSIEKNTWDALCRLMPRLIHTISPERVAEELVRSLKGNPVQTYLDWKNSGALRELIPELASLSPQEEKILIQRFKYLTYFGRKKEITPVLLLSCLLSEPALRECEEKIRKGSEMLTQGRDNFLQDYREASFYNLKIPDSIARRMFLPGIREIKNLLNNFVRLIHYKQLAHRRAVAEKILSGNPLAPQILILYRAHQKASLRKKVDFDFLMDKFRAVPRLVSGTDFLERKFFPGPHMSFILESIRDKELWDEIKTKKEAIKYGEELFHIQFGLFENHITTLETFIRENAPLYNQEELINIIGKTFGREIRELFFADCLRLLELYQEKNLLKYTFYELYTLFTMPETEPHYYFRTYYDTTIKALRMLLEEVPEVPHCVILALTLLDIGKAHSSAEPIGTSTGDDHAGRGAAFSERLCRRIGLDESLISDVSFIIRNHTIFSSKEFEKEIVPLVQKNREDLVHNLIMVCYYSMRGRFDLTGSYQYRIDGLQRQIQWINKNRIKWKREHLWNLRNLE